MCLVGNGWTSRNSNRISCRLVNYDWQTTMRALGDPGPAGGGYNPQKSRIREVPNREGCLSNVLLPPCMSQLFPAPRPRVRARPGQEGGESMLSRLFFLLNLNQFPKYANEVYPLRRTRRQHFVAAPVYRDTLKELVNTWE